MKTSKAPILFGLLVALMVVGLVWSLATKSEENTKRIDLQLAQTRDLHCAILGYRGPDIPPKKLIPQSQLVPARDCGKSLGNVEATQKVVLGLEQANAEQLKAAVDAFALRAQGIPATVVIIRTKTQVVVKCVRPNGKPC